ncbi:MAG: ABC transporter permease [Kiritimatiellia bacterium]|jgi:ABC-type transport system involved in multi-copper enzyme maturation permease subunit
MSARSAITAREAAVFRHSSMGWCVVAGTLCATALFFHLGLGSAEGHFLRVEQIWCYAAALCTPFTAALATMRLFAGERRDGTLPLLLATPVGERSLVFGKYRAAVHLVWLSLALASFPLFLLHALAATPSGLPPAEALRTLASAFARPGEGPLPLDPAALAGAALFLAIHALPFTAFGTLCSVAARRPAAAAGGMLLALGAAGAAGATALLFFPEAKARAAVSGPVSWIAEAALGNFLPGPFLAALAATACMLFLATRLLEDERCR